MAEELKNPINKFVEDLLTKANLADVSEEKREEYHQNILGLVQQKLGMETMKLLPPEHMDEFIKLNDKKAKPEELQTFLQKAIPDLDKKIVGILQNFEKDFMSMINQADNLSENK